MGLRARRHGTVTQALRAAAEAAGARVRTDAPVERILVDEAERVAAGVLVEDGREVRAPVVVSNADPLRTASLAGLPPPDGWRQDGPVVKVMLLLDGLPDFPVRPGPEPWQGTIDIGFTLEDLRRAAADARDGGPTERPWIELGGVWCGGSLTVTTCSSTTGGSPSRWPRCCSSPTAPAPD